MAKGGKLSQGASEQSQRFIRTARELGCDTDQETFERALRQVAKAKPAPRAKKDSDKPSE